MAIGPFEEMLALGLGYPPPCCPKTGYHRRNSYRGAVPVIFEMSFVHAIPQHRYPEFRDTFTPRRPDARIQQTRRSYRLKLGAQHQRSATKNKVADWIIHRICRGNGVSLDERFPKLDGPQADLLNLV